ncbi:lamina-associated polypeptide 2, isoforms alpha/zeta-like [Dendropsophus ebraccatus]|uniref:lamina-associated polypeptide 2, isoforms alpha/zeta-like n=1 Tax=Dendropsophus ebraccatus TaxID=150705 RepID=UPI0038311CC1
MNRVLEDQGPSFMRNIRDMIRHEIRASLPSNPTTSETVAPPAPIAIPSTAPTESSLVELPGPSRPAPLPPPIEEDQEQSSVLDEPGEIASEGENEGEESSSPLLTVEYIDSLVKAVRCTMEIEETPQLRSVQDRMFEGLAPKKRPVFPVHQSIKHLISNEWSKPDRKFFIPQAYKRKYPFSHEDAEYWENAPMIDPPVAKISKKNALPFEDSATMKDPMDKRAEVYLRKNWEASTATFKPLIATTSVARSLQIWMSELKDKVYEGNPEQDFATAFSTIENAVSFISEASADALKLSARSAALSNSARRTLWLKEWKGDTTSKTRLCGVPCEGKFLFGSALDVVLEKASDRKKGFPLIQQQQQNRSFRGRGRKPRGGSSTSRRDWRPTKKGKGFLFPSTETKKPSQ